MPILNRAGMSGTAMIACVNPQSDDYDETLSILGNASIASRIKEISDVGRTASQHTSSSTTAALVAANAAAVKERELVREAAKEAAAVAAKEAKEAAASKRRRVESVASTGSSSVVSQASLRSKSRDSVCVPSAAAAANANPGAGGKRQPNTKAVVLSGAKRKVESVGSVGSAMTAAEGDSEESELKRLRREVFQLREDKAQMEFHQLTRETEIREEVSVEMAKFSSSLLKQIQSLQNQLSEQGASSSHDITRSVKKERKRQMTRIAEEFSGRDLVEAEEELERMKTVYEQEIEMLKAQNSALSSAVQKLQGSSVGPAGVMPPSSVSVSLASKFNSVISGAGSEVAAEFSKRFAKKNDENCVNIAPMMNHGSTSAVEKKSPFGKSPLANSPNRSPLSEVRNAGNSPVMLQKNYQNGTVSAAAKRVDSPQRIRDENTATAVYGTRLRSQIRA